MATNQLEKEFTAFSFNRGSYISVMVTVPGSKSSAKSVTLEFELGTPSRTGGEFMICGTTVIAPGDSDTLAQQVPPGDVLLVRVTPNEANTTVTYRVVPS